MSKKKDKKHKRLTRNVLLIGSILAIVQVTLDIIERLIRLLKL